MTPTTPAPSVFAPPTPRRPWLTALLALAVYVAFNLLLPLAPLPHHKIAVAAILGLVLFSTMAFMLLQLWLAQAIVAVKPRPAVSGLAAFIFVLLFALFYWLSAPYDQHPELTPLPLVFGQSITITLGCTFLGILLSSIIREPNVLLPVALVAMPIDYLGAMTSIGFTHQIVNKHPGIVKHFSVPVPGIGSSTHHGGLNPIAFIGLGDILFVAFFLAVILRFNMNVRGTFWWMYGLLTLTMLIVLSPFGFNIAALVPMGLAVLIANFRYFKLKREEVFATFYAGLLIIALVTGFYLYYSHTHKPAPQTTLNASKGGTP